MISILKNKKGILPSHWVGLIVMIGMIVVASTYWIGAWDNKYSQLESSDSLESYNKISEAAILQNSMESTLQADKKANVLDYLDFVVNGAYQVLKITLSIPLTLIIFIKDAAGQFEIPQPYVDGVIILISAAALFGVIGAIFRRRT